MGNRTLKQIGVIGLGDMGSGLAKNILASGYRTVGFDLNESRLSAFREIGGQDVTGPAAVGAGSDAVFIMVMTGEQAKSVIFGEEGLVSTMKAGSAIILTATITAKEVKEIAERLKGSGVHLIDSPVSGGFHGAQTGTLTMMPAAPESVLERFRPVLEAVSASIHVTGNEPGMGQIVKACLQSLIGSVFAATFEASVLAAKAGVDADVLLRVFSTSGAGCGIVNTSLENIISGQFEGTGSHINTIHKDLTIVLDLARELQVPLFSAATAMQLFEAGRTRYPQGDNWVVTRILEEVTGARLRRTEGEAGT